MKNKYIELTSDMSVIVRHGRMAEASKIAAEHDLDQTAEIKRAFVAAGFEIRDARDEETAE
jgi:hypothetical protein